MFSTATSMIAASRLDAVLSPALIPTLIWGLVAGTATAWIAHRYDSAEDAEGYEYAKLGPAHCETCQHEIQLTDAVPGRNLRCSSCSSPLPMTWVGTQLAVLAGCIAMLATWGSTTIAIPFMWLVPVVIAAAVIDMRTMLIPKKVVWVGLGVGIALIAGVAVTRGQPDTVWTALIGSAAYFAFLFVMHIISPGGMGFGDVRLSLVLGLYLGWIDIRLPLFGLLIGNLVYLAYAVPQRISKGKEAGRFSPFGPGLALGTLIAVFFYGTLIPG